VIPHRTKLALDRAAIALVVTCVFTFYGLLNYWQGIEAPTAWNHAIAPLLLLPIAALSTICRAASHDGHLSNNAYRLVLVFGSIGQFFYYYGFLALVRYFARKITTLLTRNPR
jgi:EamA domain-containing membrane protein RarD